MEVSGQAKCPSHFYPLPIELEAEWPLDLICMFWRAGTLYWSVCCQLFKCQTVTCENYVTVGVSTFSIGLNDKIIINFWNVRISVSLSLCTGTWSWCVLHMFDSLMQNHTQMCYHSHLRFVLYWKLKGILHIQVQKYCKPSQYDNI